MKYGICVECKVRNNDSSEKELHKCPYCERFFCAKHFEPKPVYIPDFRLYSKYPEFQISIETESTVEGKHPCFQFTRKWVEEKDQELQLQRKLFTDWLDRSKGYRYKELVRIPSLPKKPKKLRLGDCPLCYSSDSKTLGYNAKIMTFQCNRCGYEWTQEKRSPYKVIEAKLEGKFSTVEPVIKRVGTGKIIAVALLCIMIGMGVGYLLILPRIQRFETTLDEMEYQITNLQTQLEEKDNRIEKLEIGYQSLQSEHDKLVSVYNLLNVDYEKLLEQYETMYESRYKEGYETGYTQGLTETGYDIIDPTYQEALQFIRSDKTDRNRWTEKYTCFNFAADFKNNAFEARYKCGLVFIEFPGEVGHAIVCFDTTDKGLIFVEPQDDELVTLTIGEHYFDRSKYLVPYDDTIISFLIIW